MRGRTPRGALRPYSDSEASVRPRSKNVFLPRRPRGAYFVVLSSAGCKFAGFANVDSVLGGTTSPWTLRTSGGSAPMLVVGVFSELSFVNPVLPGQAVVFLRQIKDPQMSVEKSPSRWRSKQETSSYDA